MSTSQNGWPAIDTAARQASLLHTWVIPAKNGEVKLRLRNGSGGFILALHALWMSEEAEDMTMPGSVPDDWGHAFRVVRGFSATLSNHASGTAYDGNATRHPLGVRGTWSPKQIAKIHKRLGWKVLNGCIRWGEDYHNRKDGMHFELNRSLKTCERVAKVLMKTPRGRRILAANPGQEQVIRS